MGYVQDIREYIGHRPLVIVGATIVVWDDNGRLLLQHRSDTHNQGIPGYAMEPGETVEEAAARELYEETGLTAGGFRLLGVYSGPEYYFVYPNGDESHTIIVLYEALNVRGDLSVNDGESLALGYFDLDNLPELEARTAHIIERIKESRGQSEVYRLIPLYFEPSF